MSKTEYTIDNDLDKLVKKIIESSTSSALAQLQQQELKIHPVMKIRSNKDGEHEQNPGPPAKIQKVSDLWKLFTDAHYLLVVDYYFFKHANCVEAGIFNALCEIEVTAKDGEIKLATKKPEIQVFAATLQEYGAYDNILLGLRDWMNTAKSKAAKSFVEKVATGTLEPEGGATEPPNEDSDPPRVHAGSSEEQATPTRRGGRSKR